LGQTNATLVVTNATAANAGSYDVVTSNPHGMTLSRRAPLSFFALSQGEDGLGLDLTGVIGTDYVYELQYVTEAGRNDWQTLTNLTLPTNPYRFVDPTASSDQQRYYRAVLLPW